MLEKQCLSTYDRTQCQSLQGHKGHHSKTFETDGRTMSWDDFTDEDPGRAHLQQSYAYAEFIANELTYGFQRFLQQQEADRKAFEDRLNAAVEAKDSFYKLMREVGLMPMEQKGY